MILKRIFSTIIIFSLFITSCNDDFLERKPIAEDTEVTFYSDFESLDMTATAAYAMLCSKKILDIMYIIGLGSQAEDVEVGGEDIGDLSNWESVSLFEHSPTTVDFDDIWGYMYKGARFTNEFLHRVEDVVEEDPATDINDEIVKQRIAEMKFLRAFYHFVLLETFGGVPIADKVFIPEEFQTPRNTIAEVLHFIQNDLEEAIPDLVARNEVDPQYGRATVGAANALMAKALLFESSYAENYGGDDRFAGCEEKWDDAYSHANAVIGSGEYELVGINGERFDSWREPIDDIDGEGIGGFRWLFTHDGDNSREGVFEVQNVQDNRGWIQSRGTYIVTYSTARFYEDDDGSHSAVGGWSFNLPTDYLVDAFGNDDNRYTGLNSSPVDPQLDPRFQTTIGLEGDLIASTRGSNTIFMPIIFGIGDNVPTNMIGRKFECSPEEYWFDKTNDMEGPINLRLIRYADVILMAAEAAYKTGDEGRALELVNMVRTRARESGNTGYPENLDAISFEDIMHERRIELALEGHRFQDLVRWGETGRFIDGHFNTSHGTNVIFEKGKHEFLPIPFEEVHLSKGTLEQYPAWRN